jgi:hypothetical protein
VLAAALVLAPSVTSGQGRISGVVTDADAQPVPYAWVQLRDGASLSADEAGRFALDAPATGLVWIAAIGPGCAVAVDSVLVSGDRESAVRLQLPSPAGQTSRESTVAMSRAELAARNFRSVYEALRAMAPYMVSHLTGEVGGDRYVSNRAGRTFAGNQPLVFLDGIRLTDVTAAALEDIPIDDLERIEVARGASAAFRYGIGGASGVIVLTTTRAGQPLLPPDPATCEIPFPPRG